MAAWGRRLVARWHRGEDDGRAVALASWPRSARGTVWPHAPRAAGGAAARHAPRLPRRPGRRRAGRAGGLAPSRLAVLVPVWPLAPVWRPLAAALPPATGATGADSPQAPLLLDALAPLGRPGRFVLADPASRDPASRDPASRDPPVARDDGSAGRPVFPAPRSQAIESWNAPFPHRFARGAQLPPTGRLATPRLVLGAVGGYHLTRRDQFLAGRCPRCGLHAACTRRED